MYIDEYQQKFIDLLPYCPHICTSYDAKYDHFLQGLNQEIFNRVTVRDNTTSYEGLCRRRHPPGQCNRASGACFLYGEMGHLRKDCPNLVGEASESGSGSGSQATGQVFALKQDQAQADSECMIASTFSLCGFPACVFIDTGASHSFISTRFVKRFRLSYFPLDVLVAVSIPMGQEVLAKRPVLGCVLSFEGHQLSANLMFCPEDGDAWYFYGEGARPPIPVVSALKACHALESGGEGYLIYAIDTSLEGPDIQEIPVVREFSDVFPDEILGLPPVREVEFGIELLPVTSPISRSPYCLASTDVRELQKHLQDLLDKGYI
ncbi:uncharacterized protein [Henckelia pumila]|uniref:uncharacterized protein n=1 Tax=Henckelia pumila TaxID=405737 RepID=UPI003C6E4434